MWLDGTLQPFRVECLPQRHGLLLEHLAAGLETVHIVHVLRLLGAGLGHHVLNHLLALAAELPQLVELAVDAIELGGHDALGGLHHLPDLSRDRIPDDVLAGIEDIVGEIVFQLRQAALGQQGRVVSDLGQ